MDAAQTVTDNSSITVAAMKADYLQAVQKKGFLDAHQQTLKEIKDRLDRDPYFRDHPVEAAKQAVRLHTQCIFMAAFEHGLVPPVPDLDRLFVQIFGETGQAVIH